jgi:TonB family protein
MNKFSNSTLEIEDVPEISQRTILISGTLWGPVAMLPDRRPPWKEFIFSLGSQAILVIVLLWVAILHPNALTAHLPNYRAVRLVNTPPPVDRDPAPVKPIHAAPVMEFKAPSNALKLPRILPRVERPEAPVAPKIQISNKMPIQTPVTVIPKEAIKTNVFSTGSSQVPTIEKPPQEVQTGGFGDPRGASSRENKDRQVTIARAGAFDLPSGSGNGNGNGTAGQHGRAGMVASTGFGDGTATATAAPLNGTIHAGGFGDVQAGDANQNAAKHTELIARVKPAEILSKPVPAYTEEARRLHIEGEVLLEVVFQSSGAVRVVRVVHGLGHGLDEAAIKAAQQIRFNPAQKDGQPVDFTGTLHIVFQLA